MLPTMNPKLRQMMKMKITIMRRRKMLLLVLLPLQPHTSRLEPVLMFKVKEAKRL